MVEKGIPKKIIEELDVRKKVLKKEIEVSVVIEEHQAKLPIPKKFRLNLGLKKGKKRKAKVSLDKTKKILTYKF